MHDYLVRYSDNLGNLRWWIEIVRGTESAEARCSRCPWSQQVPYGQVTRVRHGHGLDRDALDVRVYEQGAGDERVSAATQVHQAS